MISRSSLCLWKFAFSFATTKLKVLDASLRKIPLSDTGTHSHSNDSNKERSRKKMIYLYVC